MRAKGPQMLQSLTLVVDSVAVITVSIPFLTVVVATLVIILFDWELPLIGMMSLLLYPRFLVPAVIGGVVYTLLLLLNAWVLVRTIRDRIITWQYALSSVMFGVVTVGTIPVVIAFLLLSAFHILALVSQFLMTGKIAP
jgi:hypothetical protein